MNRDWVFANVQTQQVMPTLCVREVMKIPIIIGHPDSGSLNHAIAHAVRDDLLNDGDDVMFHDLYKEEFPPLLSADEIPESAEIEQIVEIHCNELSSANGIVIVHPNWWSQPPAILKGWIDRVFRPGIAYRFEEGDGGEGIPVGLLNASADVVINTSNTPAEREQAAFGDPLELIWRRCIFDLCGVTNFHRRMFSVVVTSTMEQRLGWIEESKMLRRTALQYAARNNSLQSDRGSAALRSCR
jgi:NAD(P)H dehydrogenase (quinone)